MAHERDIISGLAPQMKQYYEIGTKSCPFLMFQQPGNLISEAVNTDELGFRINHYQGREYSVARGGFEYEQVSMLIGGSTVFGDGATSDAQTISAHLSQHLGHLCLNLGGRAYNSTQELILFNQIAHRYQNVKNIVLLSGLNDLYLSRFAHYKEYFGGFFFSSILDQAVQEYSLSSFQKLMKIFLFPIFGHRIDYHGITKFNWFPRNQKQEELKDEGESGQLYNVDAAVFQIKKNLFTWSKIAQSYPCKLKFVLQPFPEWAQKKLSPEERRLLSAETYDFAKLGDRTLYADYADKLKSVCAEFGIEFYDSNRMLNDFSQDNQWFFIDRAHLTDEGNRVMAKMIQGLLNIN